MKGTSRAALGLAVLGVAIPKYGIVVTGLSAMFVIFTGRRRSKYAKTAVLVNFCNIFFLSPLLVLSLYYVDLFEQPLQHGRVTYALVLCLQLITLIMLWHQDRRKLKARQLKLAKANAGLQYSET